MPGPPRAVRPVINATGRIDAPEFGGSPLSAEARTAAADAFGWVSLTTEGHTDATEVIASRLATLADAAAATLANSLTAALAITLDGSSSHGAVIAPRTDLIEAGTFRLHDAIAASGADILEIGAANKFALSDIRRAVESADQPRPRAIVRLAADPSGSERPNLSAVIALGRDLDIPVVVAVADGNVRWDRRSPSARHAIETGATAVVVGTDGLFGGPPGAVVLGGRDIVDRARRSRFAPAARMDRIRVAALEATVWSHERSRLPVDLPAVAMRETDAATLQRRADRMASALADATVLTSTSSDGLAAVMIDVACHRPDRVARMLFAGDPAIACATTDTSVRLHVRTIPPSRDAAVAAAVANVVRSSGTAGDESHEVTVGD